jgi:transposase-like protein
LLEAKMAHNLGYEKNDRENKETTNRRNGHRQKTVCSDFGDDWLMSLKSCVSRLQRLKRVLPFE